MGDGNLTPPAGPPHHRNGQHCHLSIFSPLQIGCSFPPDRLSSAPAHPLARVHPSVFPQISPSSPAITCKNTGGRRHHTAISPTATKSRGTTCATFRAAGTSPLSGTCSARYHPAHSIRASANSLAHPAHSPLLPTSGEASSLPSCGIAFFRSIRYTYLALVATSLFSTRATHPFLRSRRTQKASPAQCQPGLLLLLWQSSPTPTRKRRINSLALFLWNSFFPLHQLHCKGALRHVSTHTVSP